MLAATGTDPARALTAVFAALVLIGTGVGAVVLVRTARDLADRA